MSKEPSIPNVDLDMYVRIVGNHELELFWDRDGLDPVDVTKPKSGQCRGKIQFHFIYNNNPGHHWENGIGPKHIETAALIVIAQTELDLNDGEIKRNSPFEKNPHSDMCHYISDPDPAQLGNLKGGADSKAEPKGGPIEKQFITAGKVKFRDTNPYPKGADPSGVIKWALVALCDGGKKFCAVDPTIKLEA